MFVLAQVSASFVAPVLATAGAAAVSIPILIHLLSRVRRRNEPWAAMRFLREAYRRHKQRLRFEQWLLLLVRCLMVLIVALALAGPLLSGCASRWVGGLNLDSDGRVIHVVVDDTLTSRAAVSGDQSRFDALREMAMAIVDAASDRDTIRLWRSARPSQGPVETRAAVREVLRSMSPRYSGSQVLHVLGQIKDSLDHRPAVVVLLSDFSRSIEALDRPVPRELEDLGKAAHVWVARPWLGADNVQIQRLTPRRRVLFSPASAGVTVPIEMQLRRFDSGSAAASAVVEVALLEPNGHVVATTRRRPRWATGQAVTGINLDLPVQWSASVTAGLNIEFPLRSGRTFILRARLDPLQMSDALTADNERLDVVTIRHQMKVGLIGESGGSHEGLTPGHWASLALAPQGALGQGPVAVKTLSPSDLGVEQLGRLDAALVLRPDLIAADCWQRLGQFARAGGVVWLFAPPHLRTALWTRQMVDVFELSWRIDMEPMQGPTDSTAWALDFSSQVPTDLHMLAADWEAMLRPVRVGRRLAATAGESQTWLALEDNIEADGLLLAQRTGDGAVLMLGTALDLQWTNLPTKPLFVPLLHESLRSLLGAAGQFDTEPVAGQRPELGRSWRDAVALEPIDRPGEQIALRIVEENVEAVEAIAIPGVYQAATPPEKLLAVNVPADAGDSRVASQSQLVQWLHGLGDWSFIDAQNPGAVLASEAATANLSWALLWVALGLIVLETILARALSHAHVKAQRKWSERLWGLLFRVGRDSGNQGGAAIAADDPVGRAA